jgi:hypothetical protein
MRMLRRMGIVIRMGMGMDKRKRARTGGMSVMIMCG